MSNDLLQSIGRSGMGVEVGGAHAEIYPCTLADLPEAATLYSHLKYWIDEGLLEIFNTIKAPDASTPEKRAEYKTINENAKKLRDELYDLLVLAFGKKLDRNVLASLDVTQIPEICKFFCTGKRSADRP